MRIGGKKEISRRKLLLIAHSYRLLSTTSPKQLRRKLSLKDTKQRNWQKFTPSKVSHYTVFVQYILHFCFKPSNERTTVLYNATLFTYELHVHYHGIYLLFTLQLYIKVTEGIKQNTGSDDFAFTEEDTDSSQASAMELLDPHLPGLSHYWLSSLKDRAYLSLPPQFSSQLPPSGGTFYSNNVIDCVKPYYQDNWPSLLHAAAVWLASNGFESLQKSSESTTKSVSQPPLLPQSAQMLPPPLSGAPSSLVPNTDARHDYFYLVLGLSVQALCTPATLDDPQTVAHCLRALKRLFKAPFSCDLLSSDSQLSIEVLSVMHRILLTCQSKSMHTVALEIALLVGEALKQSCTTESTPLAEKGDSDEHTYRFSLESSLEPGKSCVYSLLEVAACCLLSLIPALKPKDTTTGVTSSSIVSQPLRPLTGEEVVVISHAVKVLVLATSLCAPAAISQCLPSVLHLLLSSLQYTSKQTARLAAASHGVAAILQHLKQLVSALPLSDGDQGACLLDILQSALASVLGVGAVEGEGRGTTGTSVGGAYSDMDEETQLLVMAVLILSPACGVCPPGSALFNGAVQLCRTCLHSEQPKVIADSA